MTLHKFALWLFLAYVVVAIAWDMLVAILGAPQGNSWCEAAREVNRHTDGLVALCAIALWIHVFMLDVLPAWWRHP